MHFNVETMAAAFVSILSCEGTYLFSLQFMESRAVEKAETKWFVKCLLFTRKPDITARNSRELQLQPGYLFSSETYHGGFVEGLKNGYEAVY